MNAENNEVVQGAESETVRRVKVKTPEGQKELSLTIDWQGLSASDMQELAARTIVIAWQAKIKSAQVTPSDEERIDARDFAPGRRAPQERNPAKLIEKLNKEDLLRYIELMQRRLEREGTLNGSGIAD